MTWLDAFPSSEAFEAINNSLRSDDAGRKDALKMGNAVFSFTLDNKAGQTNSWYIDLKEKGEVAKGKAPAGKEADGSSILSFCLPMSLGRLLQPSETRDRSQVLC